MSAQPPPTIVSVPASEPASSIQLRSPAKINVFLEAHGKRDDGFHELETVMLRTSLHDVLRFETSVSDQLTVQLADYSPPSLTESFPLDDSNLMLKAAHALRAHCQSRLGASIIIKKRIPAEAGLAGGSSNAATTLLGLNRLWNLNLPPQTLHAIAATLGSDINFFVKDCRAAVCTGRGERVSPIRAPGALHFVAVRPATGNSTPDVFRRLSLAGVEERKNVQDTVTALQNGCMRRLQETCFNRLTRTAQELNAEMTDLMQAMTRMTRRPTFMSGSGSTCFVIARNHREAGRLKARLQHLNCRWLAAFRVE